MNYEEAITKAKHSLDFATCDLMDAAESSDGLRKYVALQLHQSARELLNELANVEAIIEEGSDATCV